MRKLFVALAVFAAGVLTYGAVGTGAWFTDTETFPVTATAGELNISLTGPAAGGVTIEDLYPGVETGPYALGIFNQSEIPVKYRLTSSLDTDTGLWDHLRVRVGHGNCVGGDAGHDAFPGQVADVLVKDLDLDSLISIHGAAGLPAGWTHCWSFVFYLDTETGNDAQGASVSFDIVVDATQLENPGWSESSPAP